MGMQTTQVEVERIRVSLGSDWRKDLLRVRTSLSIPPYSNSDSTVVEEDLAVEGGGEESRDRSMDREDRVSDGGGIGIGSSDRNTRSLVCLRQRLCSSMVIEKNTLWNVGYKVSEGIRLTKVWKPCRWRMLRMCPGKVLRGAWSGKVWVSHWAQQEHGTVTWTRQGGTGE